MVKLAWAGSRDCRVRVGNTPDYRIKIEGEWTLQNKMFTRGCMSFWGFSAADVEPPTGYALLFESNGEPAFETPPLTFV